MNKKMLARSVAAALAVSLTAAACAADEETPDTTVAAEEEAAETTAAEEEEAAESTEEAMEDEDAAADAEANIVEAAQANEDFSILVEAVVAADLVEALSADGEFTVFAPTNEAFEAFLADSGSTKEELLENPDLADILKNHVLTTKVDSAAALEAATAEDSVETLQGGTLALSLDGDNIKVGDATVVIADVETSNGVIHAIDQVIPLG